MGRLKLRPKKPLYIALDGYDLSWTRTEVDRVKMMWRQGRDIREIALAIRGTSGNAKLVEMAVLIMDLSMKGQVVSRKNGVFSA